MRLCLRIGLPLNRFGRPPPRGGSCTKALVAQTLRNDGACCCSWLGSKPVCVKSGPLFRASCPRTRSVDHTWKRKHRSRRPFLAESRAPQRSRHATWRHDHRAATAAPRVSNSPRGEDRAAPGQSRRNASRRLRGDIRVTPRQPRHTETALVRGNVLDSAWLPRRECLRVCVRDGTM